MTEENEKIARRYEAAAHAMQSGVAVEMNHNPKPTEPKHLRVGINAAMVDHAGLAQLLMDKGIITEEEYLAAIAVSMEKEKLRYETYLSRLLGNEITLA